jgi:hypothetical protein
MKIAWALAVLACATMVSCGGDDDDATPAAMQTTETTAEADDGGGSSASGGPTKPGATLKLGETAHVTYKPLTATTIRTYSRSTPPR